MTSLQPRFTILIVDDEEAVHQALDRFFGRAACQLLSAKGGEEAIELLRVTHVDLMLLDLKVEGMRGLEVLKLARELTPDLKVIIHTGHGGVSEAVEALKLGASDFLEKEGSLEILKKRVEQVYELWELARKNKGVQQRGEQTFSYQQMVGESSEMLRLKELIVRVAPTDTTVLIQGESGTGKELLARAIHHHSYRSDQPFVVVDCASINEGVIESELFGHVKGAFTGADANTLGLIRAADKGTLFLDEIGELSAHVQARFLRTIQERIVRPVGSTRNFPVDLRIVAATNRNLQEEIAAGNFRQDLYYRLSPVTLTSPPLRKRNGDVELLARFLLQKAREEGQRDISISDEAMAKIIRHDWPGNVRELENVLRGAIVFARDSIIRAGDLPPAISGLTMAVGGQGVQAGTLASYELEAIINALKQSGNNRRKAAEILDISEATLYRKIKLYKL